MIYVAMYLTAIVLANLSVAKFGPGASIVNAFLFIGLDLTARDRLHDAWHRRGLVRKMAFLIGAGSGLSFAVSLVLVPLFGQEITEMTLRIGIASFLSFALSGIVDAIVYQALGGRARLLSVNGSNLASAAVDSVMFPALAFGFPLQVGVMAGQFVAKVFGGFLWSLVLRKKYKVVCNNSGEPLGYFHSLGKAIVYCKSLGHGPFGVRAYVEGYWPHSSMPLKLPDETLEDWDIRLDAWFVSL